MCDTLHLRSWAEKKGWKWSRLINGIWAVCHKTRKFYNPQFYSFFKKTLVLRYHGLGFVFVVQEKKHDAPGFISVKYLKWSVFWNVKKKWVQYKLGIKIICFLKITAFPQHDVTWLYSIACDRMSHNDAVKLWRITFHLRMEVSSKQSWLPLLRWSSV